MGLWNRYRLLILTVVIPSLWIAAWATGVTERFTSESIRTALAGRGLWGIVGFIVLFSGGQLLRVPSTVFVLAAVAAYGRGSGALVALVGALVSATVSFTVVRAFAGQAIAEVRSPLIRRALRNIDRRPVSTVALLRLVFQTAPPLNYVLPMTAVGWREHLLGSLLGLPAPVIVMALSFDWLLRHAL